MFMIITSQLVFVFVSVRLGMSRLSMYSQLVLRQKVSECIYQMRYDIISTGNKETLPHYARLYSCGSRRWL